MELDDVLDYLQSHDYALRDDDNKTQELAELIYNEIGSHNPSLDELDQILAQIHEEARTFSRI